MMKNALGSIENRFREAYNKGYKDGLRDGASQVTAKLVSKILEEAEAEPQTGQPCDRCEHSKPYIEYKCTHPSCKFEDEPQIDCPESCPSRDICTKSDTDCIWRKGGI